jgi:epoxyqueuosine reductase
MMKTDEIGGQLVEYIKKQGWQGTIVSITRVKDLETEIEDRHKKGLLDPVLFDEYLASFDFACEHRLANARSLIVVGVPQPQVKVIFEMGQRSVPVMIPPTYAFSIDQQVSARLDSFLSSTAYHFEKVRLPEKLLAVRSGLARYGKNNISYIPDLGSFYRPVVYVSDIPCEADGWREPSVMTECETCTACAKACPTNAISTDRFQLHAERCLTYCNESTRDFPDWLSSAGHNSLVGCMICQKVCPANKTVVKWIEAGERFNANETELLPRATVEKISRQDLLEYYDVLGRNLKALITRSNKDV